MERRYDFQKGDRVHQKSMPDNEPFTLFARQSTRNGTFFGYASQRGTKHCYVEWDEAASDDPPSYETISSIFPGER